MTATVGRMDEQEIMSLDQEQMMGHTMKANKETCDRITGTEEV